MEKVSIDHPTGRPNFTIVQVGELELAFSYRTIVAFRAGFDSWNVSENVWSVTTGKHLNYLEPVKTRRMDYQAFTIALEDVLSRLRVALQAEEIPAEVIGR